MRQPLSDDAIRLRSPNDRGTGTGRVDWGLVRAIYMRILGLVWLMKGIYGGALIIGLFGHPFDLLAPAEQASSAFSAIGDCIAGVGLWLTVGWGAVTWIAVALVEMAFGLSGIGSAHWALAMLAPILVYLVLGFLTSRQSDRQE